MAINHKLIYDDDTMLHMVASGKGGSAVEGASCDWLLAFANDCATGLIEEIALFAGGISVLNERAVEVLTAAAA